MPLLVVERQQKANVKLSETLRNTFLIPENALPPLLLYENGSTVFTNVDTEPDEQELITKLRGGGASAETPAWSTPAWATAIVDWVSQAIHEQWLIDTLP